MKLGIVLPLAVGSLALTGMVYTFVTEASPYVNVDQAMRTKGNRLHLVGDIQKETLSVNVREMKVRFLIKDPEGRTIRVVFSGNPPANMGTATRAVVIGSVRDGVFYANDMMLKCPSKYEAAPSALPRSSS